jgi:hypothetical protein
MKRIVLLLLSTVFLCSFVQLDDPQTARTKFLLCNGNTKTWFFIKMNFNGIELKSDPCLLNSTMVITPTTITNASPCDAAGADVVSYNLQNNTLNAGDMVAEITDLSETVMWLRFKPPVDADTPIDTNYIPNNAQNYINILFQTYKR